MQIKHKKNIFEFHDWFAWFPVVAHTSTGETRTVWLETISRKYSKSMNSTSWIYVTKNKR